MLRKIRAYFVEHPTASLAEVAQHLEADPEAVRGMLEVWIEKGWLQKLPAQPTCRTCSCHCDPASLELYRWHDDREARSD